MIKTVIFDLGGVIVPLDFRRGYGAIQALCRYPAEEIPRLLGSTDLVKRFEAGKVEPEEFFHGICEILGLDVTYTQFREVWSSIFPPCTLIPESLLEDLRQRYRLLLLSNTNAIHFPMIRENYPLLRHFDAFVLSYKVGFMKPAPEIYREAVSQAGCGAEECFFTDDVPAYVDAARQQGIDAVQFVSLEQLLKDLRERGIEV
jgi:HAD superfamily hydrolase (TIGR01509 family)